MSYRKYQDDSKPVSKIFISNLHSQVTKELLEKHFLDFGNIIDSFVKTRDNGSAFAFLQFDTQKAAKKAIENMNGQKIKNQMIKVDMARAKNSNRDQGGRGRGKSNGCFNCGKQGHFSRECTQARKQRNNYNDKDSFYPKKKQYNNDNGEFSRNKYQRNQDRSRSRSREKGRRKNSSRSRSASNVSY